MNTFSHVMMGKLLYEQVKERYGIYLHRDRFILGNVLPDFRVSFLTRPHYLEHNISFLRKEISKLFKDKKQSAFYGKHYSKRLGVLCHYYADFFCYAHCKGFPDDLSVHVKYESNLHRYFQNHEDELRQNAFAPEESGTIDANLVNLKFQQLQERYQNEMHSYRSDLNYAIQACTEAIVLIAASSVPTTEPLQCYDSAWNVV